ncbi:DNA-binding transcriptional regulator Nlp [Cedecea neteri]|uniref:DNA-binding transcriptional regulator Nlp n=1 Tax=Cedecea neteri TaxID=158822 RepID=A0A2X2TIX6_9ENTR|nr:DNA-binding transcriptional regulator Nlp [Cedecea neteri]
MTKGWHSADIIAGLRKKGTSLAALSRECGPGFFNASECVNASVAKR